MVAVPAVPTFATPVLDPTEPQEPWPPCHKCGEPREADSPSPFCRPLPPRPVNPAQLRKPRSGSGTESQSLKGEGMLAPALRGPCPTRDPAFRCTEGLLVCLLPLGSLPAQGGTEGAVLGSLG